MQNTTSPYHRPESGQQIADKANREGVADRLTGSGGPKEHRAVELALITYAAKLLRDLERSILQTAAQPEATTLYLLPTVPGSGKILSLVRRYAIHAMARCPRGQDFASYGRLVPCAKESAGTRLGPSGKQLGNAPLKWAFSEAAALFRRTNDPGQKYLARLATKPDPGHALPIRAHTSARAV